MVAKYACIDTVAEVPRQILSANDIFIMRLFTVLLVISPPNGDICVSMGISNLAIMLAFLNTNPQENQH